MLARLARPVLMLAALGALSAPGCRRFVSAVSSNLVPFTNVEKTVEISEEVTQFVVNNRRGDVTVEGDPEATAIELKVQVRIKEELAATTEPGTFEDHVRVSTEDGKVVIRDAHEGMVDEEDWSLVMVVRVPARLAVSVRAGLGDLTVRNTSASLELESGVGDIDVQTPTGKTVTCATGVGDVDISLGSAGGIVSLETGTGAVTLAFTEAAPGYDVSVTSGVGDLTLTLPPDAAGLFTLKTGVGAVDLGGYTGLFEDTTGTSRDVSAKLGEGGPAYRLTTGVGDITLR
jgi:hypothetical protein